MDKNYNQLIVALDFPDISKAEQLVNSLGVEVDFYKIGMQMLAQKNALHFAEKLKKQNKKVFIDAKLYDIERTIEATVIQYQNLNIDFLTVHSEIKTVKAALRVLKKNGPKILAVTVLTNMDENDLINRGIRIEKQQSVRDIVVKRASDAAKAGAHGVIASPDEAFVIKQKCPNNLLVFTPGIRIKTIAGDDQKRVNTVENSIKNGADYVILGRPVTQAKNPLKTVLELKEQLRKYYTQNEKTI